MTFSKENFIYTDKDFKRYDVQSRFVVMGLEDPQAYFKTVYNGLEKYSALPDQRKYDLDIDDKPRLSTNKRGSLTGVGWLNIASQNSSSDIKQKEQIIGHKKRPSSVSSSGANGSKESGRSFADTHSTTLITNQGGVTLTDL
ncbi:hypothetical protein FGO68_gene16381 [Halteria grandinella]|uniref:Uncharacterized protein n=1 Tax=Halteria grandinella TaxID=5974 RepID=A0A8J8T6W8_HALGN|nr:hypothetical protein FGO68_gene16381 [Halteria grandinella]